MKPFKPNILKKDLLNVLIRQSKVIQIESDEAPFTHVLHDMEDLNAADKHKAINDQQFLYNSIKKSQKATIGAAQALATKQATIKEESEDDDNGFKPELLASVKFVGVSNHLF